MAIIQSVLSWRTFSSIRRGLFRLRAVILPAADGRVLVLGLLSVSFVTASVLAFRYTNAAVRVFYRAAAIWLGLLTFLILRSGFLVDYLRTRAAGWRSM